MVIPSSAKVYLQDELSRANEVVPARVCVAPPFRAASVRLYAYGKTNIRPGCSSRASIASEGSLLIQQGSSLLGSGYIYLRSKIEHARNPPGGVGALTACKVT